MFQFQIIQFSEASLLVTVQGDAPGKLNDAVYRLNEFCGSTLQQFLVDKVPAYNSLLLNCINPEAVGPVKKAIETHVPDLMEKAGKEEIKEIIIPVCYDTLLGNDLSAMAAFHQLSEREIMAIHLNQSYRVFMIGFLPGFAYMGEVDPRIATPRKAVPVPTRAGAVGIAGRQTGIYPLNSPGGWNIVGYTPVQMFDVLKEQPALLKAGDRVKFVPVELDAFYHLQKKDDGNN